MSTAIPAGAPEANPAPTPSTTNPVAPYSPFADEREVLHDRTAIRDELSQAQASPSAARKLGGRHISRLIYSLEYAPGAVERHTAPYGSFTD